ncbi:MAG: flagellin, partial [Terracidiphilus sp.]
VSLATEASNGTLDTSQDTAANQEYQSILSEINNIGATTTYNQEQVFGSKTDIYTGDSSTAGSSINSLSIRGLSSANVGDTGGVMSYSNGQNNVFMNLSTSTANASINDTLNASGTTTMNVNYLVPGADGKSTTASAQITTGGNSGYQNTVGGMINAINQSGLGLTATFATQAQAGVQGGGAQSGIEITGGLVSAGVAPSSSSTSGTLDLTGLAAGATLAQNATVTINQGNVSQTFTIGEGNNTLATLAGVINGSTGATNSVTNATGQTLGVTANVITNGDGTQSLALADGTGVTGALSVTTTGGSTQAPIFGSGTAATTVTVETGATTVAGNQYQAATASTVTVGTGSGTEASTDNLTVGTSITIANSIANDAQSFTFVVGSGTNVIGAHASTIYTGNDSVNTGAAANTLAGLAEAIQGQSSTLGVNASAAGTGGLVLTDATAVTNQNISVTMGSTPLTSSATAAALNLYSPTVAGTTVVSAGTAAKTVLDDGSGTNLVGNTLSGSITLTNSYGSTTFTTGAGTDGNGTYYLGNQAGGNTYTGLVQAIAAHSAALGYGAAWNATAGAAGTPGLVLTGNTVGIDPITVTGTTTLVDTTDTSAAVGVDSTGTGTVTPANGTDNTFATSSTAVLQGPGGASIGGSTTLTGAIQLTLGGGTTQTFIMGNAPTNGTAAVAGAIYTGANTSASLITAINQATSITGISANGGVGGTDDAIYLQGTVGTIGAISMTNSLGAGSFTPLAVSSAVTPGTITDGVTGAVGNNAVFNITATNSANSAVAVNTDDMMTGQMTVVNAGTAATVAKDASSSLAAAGGASAPTVTVLDTGAANDSESNQLSGQITLAVGGNTLTYNAAAGDTWATLANAINTGVIAGSGSNTTGVTAVWNANAGGAGKGGLVLTDYSNGAHAVTVGGTGLKSSVADTFVLGAGSNTTGAASNTFYLDNTAPSGTDYATTNAAGATGYTLASVAAAITAYSNNSVSAQATATGLTLTQTGTSTSYSGGNITANTSTLGNSLVDVTAGGYSTATTTNATQLASNSDTLSGSLVFNVGGAANKTVTMAQVAAAGDAATVKGLISYINANQGSLGISANWVPNTTGNTSFGNIQLTSLTEGPTGTVNVNSTLTNLTDTTTGAALSYNSGAAYNVGLSSSGDGTKIYDSSTLPTNGTPTAANMVADQKSGSGIATISYSDGAGQSLSSTDLSSQSDAELALTSLNSAIADVAAQDGYIGAQINTLNAVSSVLSTQSENVQAAQNAVQATDYATATSNMSKYEILSQTGIAALAQANSQQQDVLKLLQ